MTSSASESRDPAALPLPLQRLDHGIPLPSYAKAGDAGLDLRARIALTLQPGERAVVPTGVAVAIPEGFAGFVNPRSGLAAAHGITVVNAPGTIDSGYRGEIKVVLLNTDSATAWQVETGDRIAQLVILPVARAEVIEVDELTASQRGDTGFGSSGRR